MGIINVLDTQTANMIAAGEVVDRPASAIKEMVENSVDAGAKNISVDIKGGGMLFISVSDDGSGIMRDDLPKTILRHATSKIRTGSDLDGVRSAERLSPRFRPSPVLKSFQNAARTTSEAAFPATKRALSCMKPAAPTVRRSPSATCFTMFRHAENS